MLNQNVANLYQIWQILADAGQLTSFDEKIVRCCEHVESLVSVRAADEEKARQVGQEVPLVGPRAHHQGGPLQRVPVDAARAERARARPGPADRVSALRVRARGEEAPRALLEEEANHATRPPTHVKRRTRAACS